MENLISRLEAVTTRLEKCASGKGSPSTAVDDDDDEYGKSMTNT